jgi:hypothetical protein
LRVNERVGRASRTQWLIAILTALAVGAIALYVTRPQTPVMPPVASAGPDSLDSSEIQTILPVDAIRAIDHPTFLPADKSGMRQNLNVIGVALGGEAHAFPIAYMSRIEIVNDRLGGTNIAVTW